jgi:hypothetical protein
LFITLLAVFLLSSVFAFVITDSSRDTSGNFGGSDFYNAVSEDFAFS